MIRIAPQIVEAARQGNRAALEAVIQAASGPVFNLALRMLAHRQDAEDATQEILIKLITHLGSLKEPAAAGAWAYRVATRHLVETARRGRVETLRLSFDAFAADLADGQQEPGPLDLTPSEYQLALREVKTGCTLAMLVCLSRPLRMAYILGDVFELTDKEASTALDIPAGTFRQRLRRAREAVTEFMQSSCGVQNARAACSCARRISPALQSGRVTKGHSLLGPEVEPSPSPDDLSRDIATLEEAQKTLAIQRANPIFAADLSPIIAQLLDGLED